MAGILNELNERKAYFAQAREQGSPDYLKLLGSSTARLARMVGMGNDSSRGISRAIGLQRVDADRQHRADSEQSKKNHLMEMAQGERQINQVKTLGYELGNDIDSLNRNLSRLLKELIDLTKDIKRQGGGENPLVEIFDFLGGGRRRRRGGVGGRRGRRTGATLGGGKRGAEARARARAAGRGAGTMGSTASRGGIRSTLGNAASSARSLGGNALGWVKTRGSSALESVRSIGGGNAARMLGRAGAVGAVAAGGYSVYQALKDDTKTSGEKAQSVAEVAGGTAGALALGAGGAKLGAAIGTAIAPGIGTAIGGAIGGLGGGMLGYFGGEKIVSKIGGSISSAVERSGIGDHIGRATAMVMSPFSQEAREALVSDWKNNILPSWQQTLTPLRDALSTWGDRLSKFAESIPQSLKDAASTGLHVALTPVRMAVSAVRGTANFAARHSPTAARVVGAAGRAANAVASALPLSVSSALGFVSAKYESGGRGVATISTGKGDHGGVSYGKYQLATNNGSMAKFLASAQGKAYAHHFAGLRPGTAEFNAKYREVVAQDAKGFEEAQHQYIVATHYNPLAQKIARETGLDVNRRSRAVQEAVMSTSVQYGGGTSVFTNAMKGLDLSKASDEDIINALQNYKAANVNTHFRSSSEATRAAIARRIENERADLLAVARQGEAVPKAPVTPSAPGAPTVPVTDATRATASVESTSRQSSATVVSAQQAKPAVTPVAAAAAPVQPTANVSRAEYASPVQMVSPRTPEEVKPVAVVSQPAPPKPDAPTQTHVIAAAARGNGPVNIDDIPAFIPDPSMAASLFGRV